MRVPFPSRAPRRLVSAVALTLALLGALLVPQPAAAAPNSRCSVVEARWNNCPADWLGIWSYDGWFNWKPGVAVIGDSLIQNLGPDLANQLTSTGMFWGHTTSSAGTAFFHWNTGLRTSKTSGAYRDLGQWAAEDGAKHAVVALGTNDAIRLAGSGPKPTHQEVANHIVWGMERAWQSVPGCVIVVGPSRRSGSAAAAQFVREQMAYRIWTTHNSKPANHRFVWADWDAHSKDQHHWFVGANDPHMTPAGEQGYRNFITFITAVAEVNGC